MMRLFAVLAVVGAMALCRAAATAAPERHSDPEFKEGGAVKLSEHVYMIEGMPNIGIVVGNDATLVVDTGLGPKNGAVIARTAAKLSRGSKLYLTTTHFHPEHAAGEAGFPAGTILIRPRVQQEEMDKKYQTVSDTYFKKTYPQWLEGVTFRKPDVLFELRQTLNLGGVHVELMWLGPAHTRGDEVIMVLEDGVLISGDVVQNKTGPFFDGTNARDWIKTLDAVAKLHPKLIVPDHSPPGGEGLIAAERNFLEVFDNRARVLRNKGVALNEAAKQINAEMAERYPDWSIPDLTSGVRAVYNED